MQRLILLLSLLTTQVLAGEAIIPFWQLNTHVTYTLNVSNVSAADAEVEVEFYNKDGSLYTGTYSTDHAGALNTPFTLKAGETAWIWLHSSNASTVAATLRGYGVIKSKTADGATGKAFIVAQGKYDAVNASRWMAVPVNNGMPF